MMLYSIHESLARVFNPFMEFPHSSLRSFIERMNPSPQLSTYGVYVLPKEGLVFSRL